jgi:hypothetical protein
MTLAQESSEKGVQKVGRRCGLIAYSDGWAAVSCIYISRRGLAFFTVGPGHQSSRMPGPCQTLVEDEHEHATLFALSLDARSA